MNKCPTCGAETRPGDNFCLNCGNRLFPGASSAPPIIEGATIPAPGWPAPTSSPPAPAASGWHDDSDQTIANTSEPHTVRADATAPAAPPMTSKIENPAHFVVHAVNSDATQEYPLEKQETIIGRGPESDICFPEDLLVSRTHATVRYENGDYILRDESSANGTFVNSQQLTKMADRMLRDGDKILIGDYELTFRASTPTPPGIEEGETVIIPFGSPVGESTQADEDATLVASDSLMTQTMEVGSQSAVQASSSSPATPERVSEASAPSEAAPAADVQPYEPAMQDSPIPAAPPPPSSSVTPPPETRVTLGNFSRLSQSTLPDIGAVVAASTALESQITSLQQQLSAAQEAIHNHEAEIAQTTDQLRTAMRSLAERMDSTIVGLARSRSEKNWDELFRLIQDTAANPRDIGNAMEFARRASDVDKVLQKYQGVLNTLAECNSLLRSLIGEEKS